jgi:peptidoglycan/xylan/chitin deacetylase (PgdA/CDA1 family)
VRSLHFLYHELMPVGNGHPYALEIRAFEQQLDLFARLRKIKGDDGLWPEITFDDGHISNVEYALPALMSRGIIAKFFITVGWTGVRAGYLGWPELRTLHGSGQVIGAHGWSHKFLPRCSHEELKRELTGARLSLEDKLGIQVTTMSFPGGRFNKRILAACREAGYREVYTSVPKAVDSSSDRLIGRVNVRGDYALEEIQKLLQPESPNLRHLERRYRFRALAKRLVGDRAYEKLWTFVHRPQDSNDDRQK